MPFLKNLLLFYCDAMKSLRPKIFIVNMPFSISIKAYEAPSDIKLPWAPGLSFINGSHRRINQQSVNGNSEHEKIFLHFFVFSSAINKGGF